MIRTTANQYLSEYILLRDAIPPDYIYVRCVTCGTIMERRGSGSHAGHFITKGHGGASGVYYDERNVNPQCHNCNVWEEGNTVEYHRFMEQKYGREVIDELRIKHKLPRPHSIEEYGAYYREARNRLRRERGVRK